MALHPDNPARAALTRAVNRAIANGAPVYVNRPAVNPDRGFLVESAGPCFRVTWETLTAESVEQGDYAESGFMAAGVFAAYRGDNNKPEPYPGALPDVFRLRDAVAALSDDLPGSAQLESIEANDSDPRAARWISANYRTFDGATIGETRALHIPDHITPASRARLVALICT